MRTVRWPALIAGVVLSFPLPTMAEPIAPAAGPAPVSYTHLTLPTSDLV